jgi:hypothetical protein
LAAAEQSQQEVEGPQTTKATRRVLRGG